MLLPIAISMTAAPISLKVEQISPAVEMTRTGFSHLFNFFAI
ncbi:hypothetical protein [Aquiflexum sp.]